MGLQNWWRSVWTRRASARRNTSRRRPGAGRLRPEVEVLEDRIQPSVAGTFTAPLSVSVGTNVNTSRLLGNQHEETIAIDPNNPAHLFVASNIEDLNGDGTADPGMFAAYSTDAGATWTGQIIFESGPATGIGDPQATFDQFGNLFLAYLGDDGNGNLNVFLGVSINGGRSFGYIQLTTSGLNDQPSIAVGPGNVAGQDSVWVSYNDENGAIEARGASVSGLGQIGVFEDAELAKGSDVSFGNFGGIAVGPDGEVFVVYQTGVNAAGPDTIYGNLDADGLGSGGFGSQIKVTDTNVGGARLIPATSNNLGIDAEANLAWDRSGGAHDGRLSLVYTDAANTSTDDTDIFTRFSDNNGLTWSTRRKVNDDSSTNSQFNPSISVDQTTGNLGVAWYDARNDDGLNGPGDTDGTANDDAQVWGAVSTNGGGSYSANVKISTGTSNSADSEMSVSGVRALGYGDFDTSAFTAGAFYRVWSDNSNSTRNNPNGRLKELDVYTARVLVGGETVTATGGTGDDTYVIRLDATGDYVDIYENTPTTGNPTFVVALASLTNVVVQGNGGNNSLTIDFSNGNPIPTGGISYDGGDGSNTLFLQGRLPTGPFSNEVETPSGANAGTITLDGSTITYQNLALISDTATVTNFTKFGTAAGEQINVGAGPTTNGFPTTQVNSGSSNTFAVVNFANKSNATINALGGADTISVTATASGTATTVDADGGVDTVTVGNASNGLGDLAGALTVNGGGQAGDALILDDQQASAGHTYGVSAASVTRDGAANVSYSGFTSLTLDATAQADTINVTGTAAGTATTVNAGGGLDTFGAINQTTIGAAGLTINGGGQGEALTLNGGNAAETIGVSASQVTRSDGGPVSYSGLASLTVNGTGQADTLNVTSTAAGTVTTVNAGGGLDTFGAIDQTAVGAAGLTINGGGQGEALTLNGGSAAETIGVSASQVTRSDGGTVSYAGLASLTVNGTAQADTLTVTSTASGVATTVNAKGGNDTVNVGNASDGLDDLAGALTVDGGGQAGDALILNDQQASVSHTYGVSAAGVTRDGAANVNYSGFASLTLNATAQADTINVTGTAAGTATTVNAGGGLDTFGAINQTTIAAAGLTVNGGGQGEALTLNGGSAAETIGVSASQVTRSDGGPVSYSGLASLTVNGTSQADTLNVTSAAAGTVTTVNAGGGLDTLGAIDQTTIAAAGLTINGGGQGEALTLNGGSTAETIGVSASQVTRSSGGTVRYAGLASLTVNATGQADTIGVTATASGTTTTVNAKGGDDTVRVGNASNGLGDLAGALTVDGGGQTGDALTLDDQGSASGHTYGVSAAGVTRDGTSVLNYSGFASLTLNASDQADTINVASTASGLATTVNAGGGLDTFGAIDQTTIAAAGLTINAGGQGEALTLNGGSTAETIGVSASQVTRSSGGPVNYSGLATLTVNGTGQADTITVTSTAAGTTTTVNAGGGNDSVSVGNTSNGLGSLGGALTVDGGGQAGDALTLDDQKSPAGHTYGVSAAGVTRDGTSVLNYSGFASLTLDASDKADTINVTSTASGLATTVNAKGDNDVVRVGNASNGLASLLGALTVDGGGQAGDALILNDQQSPTGHTYGVSAAGVTRDGTSVFNSISGFASLTLNASDQADTINVTGTASGLASTVNGDDGGDTYAVTQNAVAAAGLFLTDTGASGTDTLTVSSTASGPETIGVTGTQVTRTGSGIVTFSGMENLTVNGTDNATGDSFDVTPSATLPITIDGKAPTTAPGDALNYSGSAGQINAVDANNGTITEAGFQPVTYQSIETLTGNSSLVLVLDAGAQANDGTADTFLVRGNGSAFEAFVNGSLAYTSQTAFFHSIIVNGSGDDDTLTVDASASNPIPPFGIAFNAGGQTDATGDNLVVIGNGTATGGYSPGSTPGNGSLTVNSGAGDRPISFSGLEAATAHALASLTLTTPGSNDVLTVDQPAAGQNRVGGTSGGVALTPLTFFDVTTFTVDTGANDGALPDDSLTLGAAGLTASGLTNFVFKGGPGNDQLSVLGTTYSTPGSTSGISFQGGAGTDTFVGNADVNITLADSGVTSSAGGTVQFTQVEVANLTGGASDNTFDLSGWIGTGSLSGGGGTADRVVTTAGAVFTLSDTRLMVTGRANMTLAGIKVADLAGGAGTNTFDLSGWTGTGSLTGNGSTADRVVATADADFALSNARLTVSGRADMTLASIEAATLTGGGGANAFTVAGWTGTATLDGAGSGDAYNVTFNATGQTVNIADTGSAGTDAATVTGRAGNSNFTIDGSRTVEGANVVTYNASLEGLTVNGGPAGDPGQDIFNVTPSASTTITVDGGDPTTTPGDGLKLDLTGAAGTALTLTGPDSGQWTFSNRKPVVFSHIESLSPLVSIATTVPNASEAGPTPGRVVVTRSGSTSAPLTVNYTVSGTATPGVDYVALSGSVVIPAGATSANIDVLPIDDFLVEPTETVVVTLAPGDNSVAPPASAVVNILDNDVIHRYLVSSTNAGVPAEVRVFDFATGTFRFDFLPFGLFAGGVRVATADFNGDGVPDIIVATASATSYVAIFDGLDGHPLTAFFAFGGASNGVYVAAGNILGGSQAALLVGAGAGTPGSPVALYTGGSAAFLGALLPFGPAYAGGTTVGTGDVNGDGIDDFITGTATGATQVEVFSGGTGLLMANFLAFGGNSQGVNVALADLDSDGRADVLAGAGPGGPALVMAYDLNRGGVAFASFVVNDPQEPQSLTGVPGQNGVNVGAVDVNGDGTAEILATLGPGSLPRLFVFRALPLALVDAFFLYDPRFVGGTFIAGSK